MPGIVNLESSYTPEENARAELCSAAVEGLLAQYGCVIVAVAFIALDGRIRSEAHILPDKTRKAKGERGGQG